MAEPMEEVQKSEHVEGGGKPVRWGNSFFYVFLKKIWNVPLISWGLKNVLVFFLAGPFILLSGRSYQSNYYHSYYFPAPCKAFLAFAVIILFFNGLIFLFRHFLFSRGCFSYVFFLLTSSILTVTAISIIMDVIVDMDFYLNPANISWMLDRALICGQASWVSLFLQIWAFWKQDRLLFKISCILAVLGFGFTWLLAAGLLITDMLGIYFS